ncbi:peptide-methionine (S)-S-oxide reductase MsrA [Candidatus Altiarchaeota archaeon]
MKSYLIILMLSLTFGCIGPDTDGREPVDYKELKARPDLESATLAGGCFWCIEAAFQEMPGVIEAVSGYTGGMSADPNYQAVSTGDTGHYEAVQVFYDPGKVSYEEILSEFWKNIDPTDESGQFADKGSQYKTAIFYHDEMQRLKAASSLKKMDESGKYDKPIKTKIIKLKRFYEAEDYHQDYYLKDSIRYKAYKTGSGREGYISKNWEE